MFADQGFGGASIEQISEHAGLSRGAFYAHFTDKNELFLAVLEDMVDQVQDLATQRADGPTALLEAMIGVQVGHSRVDPGWFRLYSEFRTHALRDPATREHLAQHYRRLRDVIAQAIEAQFHALGVALPMAPADVAALVVALDEGLAIQRGIEPTAVRSELFLDILKTLIDAAAALDRQRTTTPKRDA